MNFDKIKELGKRIYTNKMLEKTDEKGNVVLSDAEAIKNLVDQTFTSNGEIRNLEQFRIFNKLIVETAESEARPRLQPVLDLISDYQTVGQYDKVVYTVPKKARIKLALTATGAGVDFVRISPSQTKQPATPETHQFGGYYNIGEMVSDPVNKFTEAVNFVEEEKVKYFFTKIMQLTRNARISGSIPTGQVIETAGIDIMDYRKLENKLLRYGKGARPIMVADRDLIDALAVKQATMNLGITGKEGLLLTDDLRESLLRDVEFTQILRTTAIPTDSSNTELPANEGIIVAGGEKSPFKIREYGEMRVAQGIPDIEDERVNMKIDFKVDITLLIGEAMGYLKDTSIQL